MMNKHNHHQSNCSFTGEVVAYIYDEIGKREKLAFENHLANCPNCADELAELKSVSFSIGAWRDAGFSHLQTPHIEIPYQSVRPVSQSETGSSSWIPKLRQLFSLSPTWTNGAAAMAILVFCAGLIFVAVKFTAKTDLAEINNNNLTKAAISPTAEINGKQMPEIPADNSVKTSKETETAPPDDSVKTELTKESKTANKNSNNAVKVSANSRNKVVRQNAETISPNKQSAPINDRNNIKPAQKRKSPTLNNFDEDEDDSLRLADLFAEIDTK